MKKPVYPITIYVSKSSAPKRLNINRKTIQRKVSEGKLSQNENGRVRLDEVAAILKADSIRGRRGPKIQPMAVESAQKNYKFTQQGLVEVPVEPDEATIRNQELNEQAVDDIKRRIVNLSSASLDEISRFALTISNHKKRLAKLGHCHSPAEILAALELSTPGAPSAVHSPQPVAENQAADLIGTMFAGVSRMTANHVAASSGIASSA